MTSAAYTGSQSPDTPTNIPQCNSSEREESLSEPVGEVSHRPLTDETREQAIRIAARLVEKHQAEWEATGDFAAAGRRDWAMQRMYDLIRGRSPEWIAKRERELGLL